MKNIKIEINDYIKEVMISQAIRAKYKINESGERVVSNTRSVGKPRMRKINGQDLWSGIDHHMRNKLAKSIKIYFYEIFREKGLEKFNKEDYPLSINLTFYGPLSEFDLDNHSLWYRKCIQDALCGNVEFLESISKGGKKSYIPDRDKYPAIIEDDSVIYVRSIPCNYIESEKSKLVIRIKTIKI